MQIEIDQSGKIEDTSKDTVLALSNGTQFSIIIPKRIKREIQIIFRKNEKSKKHILETYRDKPNKPIVNFGFVGKSSNSHKLASSVVKKKSKPNLVVSKKELINTIKMTEVGKQLKNA